MTDRIGGERRKTRRLMRKPIRKRGKLSLTAFFSTYKVGEKVVLYCEPAYQRGMYHLRFHGRIATIEGKRGSCYQISVRDGGKMKTCIVHPVHLKKA